jgi:hypothetical protein
MKLILSKPETSRIPLWLSFSCNELKVFGEFATITDKIAKLPGSLTELIKQIINRVNAEFEDDIVVEVLTLIKYFNIHFYNNNFYLNYLLI